VRRLHLWLYLIAVALIHGALWWQFGHIVSIPSHYDMMMNSDVSMMSDHMGRFRVITHNPFVGLFGLVLAWTHLAVFVKRWHDCDKSGWWILVNLIPVIGWLWTLIECGFFEGTVGPSTVLILRAGPEPGFTNPGFRDRVAGQQFKCSGGEYNG